MKITVWYGVDDVDINGFSQHKVFVKYYEINDFIRKCLTTWNSWRKCFKTNTQRSVPEC